MADQPPYRVIIVDDDPDVAGYLCAVLEKRGGCEVMSLTDPAEVAAAVARFDPDVVVTDIEMPGVDGIELMRRLRLLRPELRVVIMTAHISVDYAVSALRNQADEFLTKPIASADLIAVVRRLSEDGRRARLSGAHQTVLAIGAHPDDVEIAVGGIMAAHQAAGDSLAVLTLSRGSRGGAADDRQRESLAAAELIGARLFLEDLTDTRISGADPTVSIIERVVAEVAPTIVYTHSHHDRHQDHRAVHDAAMVATRDVAMVACFQSPSSTVDYRPGRFVTIDGFTERKLQLLDCFRSQTDLRDYLDPEFVLATARYWSRFGSGRSVEPLEIVREAVTVGPADRSSPHPATRTSERGAG
ncbi:MAG TPA: response regulator [Pseudolysinimonas sp.]|nr:response regulator [Pseudolysinimonas sp.]